MDEENMGQIGDDAGAAPAPAPASAGGKERKRRGLYGIGLRGILRMLRLSNLMNALLVVVLLPIVTIINLGSASTSDLDALFLLFYSTVFGVLLCCFEMNFTPVERSMRRYCGFLYSYRGRALFIFFLATLALSSQSLINYIVGAVTMVNAILNCVVIYTHPVFSNGKVRGGSSDPTFAYSRGEAEASSAARSAVERNPDLARRAVHAGVSASASYARENPDAVLHAATSAQGTTTSTSTTATTAGGQPGKTDDGFDTTPV